MLERLNQKMASPWTERTHRPPATVTMATEEQC